MSTVHSCLIQPMEFQAGVLPTGHSLAYAIVESAAEIRFLAVAGTPWEELFRYPRGVAFGEQDELRWTKRSAGWHAVYVNDLGLALNEANSIRDVTRMEEASVPDRPSRIVLLGELEENGGEFLEGRIPGPLDYPFGSDYGKGDRPAIEIRHYRTALDQEFFRLVRPIQAPKVAMA